MDCSFCGRFLPWDTTISAWPTSGGKWTSSTPVRTRDGRPSSGASSSRPMWYPLAWRSPVTDSLLPCPDGGPECRPRWPTLILMVSAWVALLQLPQHFVFAVEFEYNCPAAIALCVPRTDLGSQIWKLKSHTSDLESRISQLGNCLSDQLDHPNNSVSFRTCGN